MGKTNKESWTCRKTPSNNNFSVKACKKAPSPKVEPNPNPNYKPPIGIPPKTTTVRVAQVGKYDHIIHTNTGRIFVQKTATSKSKRNQTRK